MGAEAETKKVSRRTRVRLKLWKKKPRCNYCHKKLTFDEATVDHIIPRSKGGSGRQTNLCIACRPCNHKKGDSMPLNGGTLKPAVVKKRKRQQEKELKDAVDICSGYWSGSISNVIDRSLWESATMVPSRSGRLVETREIKYL